MRIVPDQAIANALRGNKGVSTPDLLKGQKPASKPRTKRSASGTVFGTKVTGTQKVKLDTLKGAMEQFDKGNPYTDSTPDKLTNPYNVKRQKAKSFLFARAGGQEGNFVKHLDEFEWLWRHAPGKIDEVIARFKDRRMNEAAGDRSPGVIRAAMVPTVEERYEKMDLIKKFGTDTPQLSDVIAAFGRDISPTNQLLGLATDAAKAMYDLPEDWQPDTENDKLLKSGLMAGNFAEYLTPGLNVAKIAGDASMLGAKSVEQKSLAPVGEYVKENLRALNPFESGIDPVERAFRALSVGLTAFAVKPHLSGLKAKGLGNKSRAVVGIAYEMISPFPTPNILLPRAQALSVALKSPAGKETVKVAKEIEKRYKDEDGYAEVRQEYAGKYRAAVEESGANITEADIDAAVTLATAVEMQLRSMAKKGEEPDIVGSLDVRGVNRLAPDISEEARRELRDRVDNPETLEDFEVAALWRGKAIAEQDPSLLDGLSPAMQGEKMRRLGRASFNKVEKERFKQLSGDKKPVPRPTKFKPKAQKGYDKGENLDLVGMAQKREPAPVVDQIPDAGKKVSEPATPKVEVATPKPKATAPATNGGLPVKRFSTEGFELERPVVSENGHTLTAYNWINRQELVWSEGKQEYVEKRVSDWASSAENSHTNRQIVHQFYVTSPSGEGRWVSLESAAKLMGVMPESIKGTGSSIRTLLKNKALFEALTNKIKEVEDSFQKWKSSKAPEPVIEPNTTRIGAARGYMTVRVGDGESWYDPKDYRSNKANAIESATRTWVENRVAEETKVTHPATKIGYMKADVARVKQRIDKASSVIKQNQPAAPKPAAQTVATPKVETEFGVGDKVFYDAPGFGGSSVRVTGVLQKDKSGKLVVKIDPGQESKFAKKSVAFDSRWDKAGSARQRRMADAENRYKQRQEDFKKQLEDDGERRKIAEKDYDQSPTKLAGATGPSGWNQVAKGTMLFDHDTGATYRVNDVVKDVDGNLSRAEVVKVSGPENANKSIDAIPGERWSWLGSDGEVAVKTPRSRIAEAQPAPKPAPKPTDAPKQATAQKEPWEMTESELRERYKPYIMEGLSYGEKYDRNIQDSFGGVVDALRKGDSKAAKYFGQQLKLRSKEMSMDEFKAWEKTEADAQSVKDATAKKEMEQRVYADALKDTPESKQKRRELKKSIVDDLADTQEIKALMNRLSKAKQDVESKQSARDKTKSRSKAREAAEVELKDTLDKYERLLDEFDAVKADVNTKAEAMLYEKAGIAQPKQDAPAQPAPKPADAPKPATGQKEPWEMTREEYAKDESNAVYDALNSATQPRETHVAVDLSTGKTYTTVNGKLNTVPSPGRVIPATQSEVREFDSAVTKGMVQVERRVITGSGMTGAMTTKRGDTVGKLVRARGLTPETSHKSSVEQALKDGKPVPKEVLADYPALAKEYKQDAPTQDAPVAPAKVQKTEGGSKPVDTVTAPEKVESAAIREAHQVPPAKERIPMPEEWKKEKTIPGMGLKPSQRDFLVKELTDAKARGDAVVEVKVPGDGEWKIKTDGAGFNELLIDLGKTRIQSDSGPRRLGGGGLTSANALYKLVKASDKIAEASGEKMPRVRFVNEVGKKQMEKEGWEVVLFDNFASAKKAVKPGGWVEKVYRHEGSKSDWDYHAINPPKELLESQRKNSVRNQGQAPSALIDTGLPVSTKEWDAAVREFNSAGQDFEKRQAASKALQEHVTFEQIVAALAIPTRKRSLLQDAVAHYLRASTDKIVKGKPSYYKDQTFPATLGGSQWWTDGNVMIKGELKEGYARERSNANGDKLVDDAGQRSPVQLVGTLKDPSVSEKKAYQMDDAVWHVVKDSEGQHFGINRKHTALVEQTFGKDVQWTKGNTNSVFAEKDGQLVAVVASSPVKQFPVENVVPRETPPLSQRFAPTQTNKGTYVWDAKQKRGLITLFENADISTILHETAHHQLRYMPSGMYKILANGAGVDPDKDLDKLSVADFVKVQEYWARGVESVLNNQLIEPNPKVKAAFQYAANRIRAIYGDAGVPIPESRGGKKGKGLNQKQKWTPVPFTTKKKGETWYRIDENGLHASGPTPEDAIAQMEFLLKKPEREARKLDMRNNLAQKQKEFYDQLKIRGLSTVTYTSMSTFGPHRGASQYITAFEDTKRPGRQLFADTESEVDKILGDSLPIATLRKSDHDAVAPRSMLADVDARKSSDPEGDFISLLDKRLGKRLNQGPGKGGKKGKGLNQLTPSQKKQVESPEFKRWFGDSKVVDDKGEPLVVYHGTKGDFDSFDLSRAGKGVDRFGSGFYFAKDATAASDYASPGFGDSYRDAIGNRGRVIPAYVSIKNPITTETKAMSKAQVSALIKASPLLDQGLEEWREFSGAGWKTLALRDAISSYAEYSDDFLSQWHAIANDFYGDDNIAALNRNTKAATGYDGVIAENEVVAWSPTQIKSAIGNKGSFDPNDPSILNQGPGRGGEKPDYSAVAEVFAQMMGGTVKPIREVPAMVKAGMASPAPGKDFGTSNRAMEESANIIPPDGKGRSAKELIEQAKKDVTDDIQALELADGVRDGSIPYNAETAAKANVAMGLLEGRTNTALKRLQANPNDADLKQQYADAREAIQTFASGIQVGKSGWSDVGRVLQARVDEMGNVTRMQAEAERMKGSKLTPKEAKAIQEISDKYEQAKKDLEAAKKEIETARAESAVRTAASRPRSSGSVRTIREDAKTARERLSSRTLNQLSEEASTDELVWAIAKEHILDGDKNLQSIAKKIADEFEMAPDDVIQYLGSPATPRTKSDLAIAIAKLRTEARVLTGNAKRASKRASSKKKAPRAKAPRAKADLLNDPKAIQKKVAGLSALTKKYADKRAAKDYSKDVRPEVPKAKAVLDAEAKLVAEKNKFLAERRKLVSAARRAATASKVRTGGGSTRKPRAKVDLVGNAVAIKKRIAEIDAKIKATQAKIDAQDYSVTPRAETPKAQSVKDAEAKLADTRKDFRAAKNQVALRDDPVAIQKRLDEINKKIQEYQTKLKAGDYSVPIKAEKAKAQSIIEAEGALWMERRKFESMRRHLANPEPKAKKVIKEAAGVLRWSQLGADVGALLRQGRYVVQHPRAYGKGLKNMILAMKNDESYAAVMASIENRNMADGKPAMPIRVKAGLSLTDQFTHLEEAFTSQMLKKLPVVGKYAGFLERAQVGFLNTVRAEMFDGFYNSVGDLSLKELQSRARLINSLTGRSNVKNVPEALSVIMTSPRYYASRWELLTAGPENLYKALLNGDRGAQANMKDIAASLASLAVPLIATHIILNRKDEKDGVTLDPASSDFLKIRIGGTVYDISAGMAPKLRALLRAVMFVTTKRDEEKRADTGWLMDTIEKEWTGAISPGVRTPIELYAGRSLTGFEIDDPRDRGIRKLMPLIVQQTWKNIESDAGAGIVAAHLLGEFVGATQISNYKYKAPSEARRPGTHQTILVPRAKKTTAPKTDSKPMTRQERVQAFMNSRN